MENNFLHISTSGNGFCNLGLDEWFLDNVGNDDLILYFYINQNAVIIGKNQNPNKECDLEAMAHDGVQLVRRMSGGGAVFHDSGNLNFSFIAGKNRFDKERQHNFILNCVRSLGIDCCFSGRNDLLANGRKFSGNAYCSKGNSKLHHGTLLINADLHKLLNYLTVDERKIRAKGVDSVRSRVCNLAELCPDITTDIVLEKVRNQFSKEYGNYQSFSFTENQIIEIQKYQEKYASNEWAFSKLSQFEYVFDERFDFGNVQILLDVKDKIISDVQVFTDSMDTELPSKIQNALLGSKFEKDNLCQKLNNSADTSLMEISAKFNEVF
jgi:lipoate-protein ligase A